VGGAAGWIGTGRDGGWATVLLKGAVERSMGRAKRHGTVIKISVAATSRVMTPSTITHGLTRAFLVPNGGVEEGGGWGRATRGSGAKIVSRSRATDPRRSAWRALSCASDPTLAAMLESRNTPTQPALAAAVPISGRNSAVGIEIVPQVMQFCREKPPRLVELTHTGSSRGHPRPP